MQRVNLVANLEGLWFDMAAISFRYETLAASENIEMKQTKIIRISGGTVFGVLMSEPFSIRKFCINVF